MLEKDRLTNICNQIIKISIIGILFLCPIYFAFFRENYSIFELYKIAIFRALLSLAWLAYFAKIIIAQRIDLSGNRRIFIGVFLVLLSFTLSTIFSLHPQLSMWGGYERQQGLYSLISYWLFFVLVILSYRIFRNKNLLIIPVILSASLASIYGLAQYFYIDPLWWKESTQETGRIFSTMGQPNFWGQFLLFSIPITAYGIGFFQNYKYKLIAIFCFIIQLFNLVFTYSRSAWMGLGAEIAISVILILWLSLVGRKIKLTGKILLAAMILVFCLILIKNKINPGVSSDLTLWNRLTSIVDISHGSNKIRLLYWQAAGSEFVHESWSRKLIGWGAESQPDIFVKYYRPEWAANEATNMFPDRAHNIVFDYLLQFGLLGLVSVLALTGCVLLLVFRFLSKLSVPSEKKYFIIILLAAIAGYLVNDLFSFSSVTNNIYFCLVLGILVNISRTDALPEVGHDIKMRKGLLIIVWFFLLFLLSVLLYFYNIKPLLADHYFMNAKKAEVAADCRQIIDNMALADEYNPVSTFYKEKFLLMSVNCFSVVTSTSSQKILADNIQNQIDSIGKKEYQYGTWMQVARARSILANYLYPDQYPLAEKIFLDLEKTNPYLTFNYVDLGRLYLWQKKYDKSGEQFRQLLLLLLYIEKIQEENPERIAAVRSDTAYAYNLLASTYYWQKDYDQAVKYKKLALSYHPSYIDIYKDLSDIYYQKHDLDQSIAYLKKGFRQDSKNGSWPYNLALLYKDKKDYAQALRYAQEAEKLNPQDKIKNLINELKR